MRRSFASAYVANGIDTRVGMRIVGHKSPKRIDHYLQRAKKAKEAALAKLAEKAENRFSGRRSHEAQGESALFPWRCEAFSETISVDVRSAGQQELDRPRLGFLLENLRPPERLICGVGQEFHLRQCLSDQARDRRPRS